MDRLKSINNSSTMKDDLITLIKYYLIRDNYSRMDVKIYSLKHTVSMYKAEDIPNAVEDELDEYLSKYFDTVEVKAENIEISKSGDVGKQGHGLLIKFDVAVSKEINGEVIYTRFSDTFNIEDFGKINRFNEHN